MLPSTSLKYGELKNTPYNHVIEYSETRSTQSDLAKMPSVQAGILYQIDLKDGNKTTVYNFRPIDRNVEIYDLATPLSSQKLPNSVRSILSAEPGLQLSNFAMHDIANELTDATKMQITYSGPAKIPADRKIMQRIFLNLALNSSLQKPCSWRFGAWAGNNKGSCWRVGGLCKAQPVKRKWLQISYPASC